jgi:small subunit ribosomal protein S20
MPINKSALKRERQNNERRLRNKTIKSKVKTAFKKLSASIDAKKKNEVEVNLKNYISEIDKAVKKGVYHTNKGKRNKSRIMKKVNQLFNEKKSA